MNPDICPLCGLPARYGIEAVMLYIPDGQHKNRWTHQVCIDERGRRERVMMLAKRARRWKRILRIVGMLMRL